MPLLKVQVATFADSSLPRDAIVNTFHLNKEGPGNVTDYDTLATDAAAAFAVLYGAKKITAKIYEARGAPPHYPVGEGTVNPTATPSASGSPREVACCLSYYGARNLPRTRGRMFICATLASLDFGVRPSAGDRTKILALGTRIAALGGLDVDWQVYSPTSDAAENVQTMFVDDEWDTIRSRGLRASTRSVGAISE